MVFYLSFFRDRSMWVAVFIMWMGNIYNVFVPNSIFFTKEDCEEFRAFQYVVLESTKPHEQSGVFGSVCVQIPKEEST